MTHNLPHGQFAVESVADLGDPRLSAGVLQGFLLTAVYCVAIALGLWALGVSGLRPALIVSLSIGLSIRTSLQLLQPRLQPRLGAWLTPALCVTLGILAGSALGGALAFDDALRYFQGSPGTLVLGLVFGVIGYLMFGTRARLLASRLRIAELERSRAEQQRQLADTRLQLLQAQIEPHFLFNTLATVQSLVRPDPERAEHALAQLTALLRRSLARTREAELPLEEEMELLSAYLEIQRIRMGDRLSYELKIAPALVRTPVPPLLLQPLVENAITHGLEHKKGAGRVSVQAERREHQLLLSVEDDGPGLDSLLSPESKGAGMALTNIRARLEERYGDRASLRLLERDGGGIRAELRLPLDPDSDQSGKSPVP